MGGYVNLSVRRSGKISHTLSYTGCINRMFEPKLYMGDQNVISALMNLYKDSPEQTDPEARKLCPCHYGLIVFDYDTHAVFDMQQAAPINMVSINFHREASRQGQHLLWLGQNGWLADRLVSMVSGNAMTPIPEGVFASRDTLLDWAIAEEDRADQSVPRDEKGRRIFRLDGDVVPSFVLQPPGWTFRSFGINEGLAFRDALFEAGFVMTDAEKNVWQEWIQEHPAEEATPAVAE